MTLNGPATDFPYEVPSDVVDAVLAGKRFVLVGHVTPDSDCLGSILGAARAIRQGGKSQVEPAILDGHVSRRLRFMLDLAEMPITTGPVGPDADTALIFDTAKSARVNVPDKWEGIQAPNRKIVNIDHHASNQGFGHVNWIVPDASSTCEILYWLLRKADLPIDPKTASLLYCGVWGDTAGFSLPNTSKPALQAAAGLVAADADVEMIGQCMCRSAGAGEFQLLRVVYDNTKLVADKRISYSTINHDELNATGCMAADIDDQVEIPRSLENISIALLFSEGVKGKIRINLRGENGISVLPLAQELGGGGHSQAAGSIMSGTIAEVVEKVVGRAEQYLNEKNA